MLLNEDFRTVIIGGKEYKLHPLDRDALNRFYKRFRDQSLVDFAKLIKEQDLPMDIYKDFVADHYKNLPKINDVVANYADTIEGRLYWIYLMMVDVSEDFVNSITDEELEVINTAINDWIAPTDPKKK